MTRASGTLPYNMIGIMFVEKMKGTDISVPFVLYKKSGYEGCGCGCKCYRYERKPEVGKCYRCGSSDCCCDIAAGAVKYRRYGHRAKHCIRNIVQQAPEKLRLYLLPEKRERQHSYQIGNACHYDYINSQLH